MLPPAGLRGVASRLALPALLSQVLVAFTIEFDNEFEHRFPHSTTRGPSAGRREGPWLVSQAMWANFLQFIDADGVPLRGVAGLAAITNLAGMKRWGYLSVGPDPDGDETASPANLVVRLTARGLKAQRVLRPLAEEIEQRWRARFGEEEIERLRVSLQGLVDKCDMELPQYLPVVSIHMFAGLERLGRVPAVPGKGRGSRPDLSVLLAKVLLMFTVEFERESKLSLPTSANALRVLDETGVRVRGLPLLTGVSKEAVAMSVGLLRRLGCVVVEPDPAASREKVVRLTPKGAKAQEKYRRVLGETERQWRVRFGADAVANLRAPLERLVGGGMAASSPLSAGTRPYPDGWRAAVRRPETLPHYPMVLHRGGFPDGS